MKNGDMACSRYAQKGTISTVPIVKCGSKKEPQFDSEKIHGIIMAIKIRLENEGCYTLEKLCQISTTELTEKGYNKEIIKMWVDCLD